MCIAFIIYDLIFYKKKKERDRVLTIRPYFPQNYDLQGVNNKFGAHIHIIVRLQ